MWIITATKIKLSHHKYDIKIKELYIHLKCFGLNTPNFERFTVF